MRSAAVRTVKPLPCGGLVIARALVIGKEEQLVLDDSAANCGAEFIPAE